MNAAAELDIGPLTWVKGEIDLALERAVEALGRHGDEDDADSTHLKAARMHLHQAHGALSIIGLDGVTRFSEAVEQLLEAVQDNRIAWGPEPAAIARDGIAAIRRYLDDLIGGQPNQPLRLLPTYRAVLAALGQPEAPAADLFFPDLTLRPPRREREPAPLAPVELDARIKAARMGFQRGLLKWLKSDPRGIVEMRGSVAIIEMTQAQPAGRAFWWAALAFLDAVAAGAVQLDAGVRHLCARIDTQIKKLLEGSRTVAERLMRDVLYHVAVAGPAGDHVECVRAAYRLADQIPQPAAASIEPLRPALRACRDLLALAMDDWNRFCAGIAAALPQFHDRVRKLTELTAELWQTDLARLAKVIAGTADELRRTPLSHSEALGLEMATALLLFDNALEGFQRLGPEFARQAATVGNRLDAALHGEPLAAMEMPQLDEMSRQAQEKLLLRQVVKEIQVSLGVVEQALDAFFRDQSRTGELASVDRPLKQIEGALAVLGQERAVAVLRECGQAIAGFSAGESQPSQQADFEQVAARLSALGFFVEQLQHGPADIDSFLHPQAMPAAEEAPEPAADEEWRSDEIPEAVGQVTPAGPEEAAPSPETVRLAEASNEEIDAELLGIFIEEAHEVLGTVGGQLPQLAGQPHDREALTTVRRGFHTLKGSGRMVGLAELGEAAWAVEQVLNRWLQLEQEATPALLAMLAQAHQLCVGWVAQLESGGGLHRDASALVGVCEQLKREEAPPAEAAPEPQEPRPAPVLRLVAPPPPAPAGIQVGNLVLSPTLYDLYVGEAREHIAALQRELGMEGPPRRPMVRAAHTLAGISATTGIIPINHLAHALEMALNRLDAAGVGPDESQHLLIARTVGALEGMVGAVAERRLPQREEAMASELDALMPRVAAAPAIVEAPPIIPAIEPPPAEGAFPLAEDEAERRQMRLADDLDPQILPIFLEESADMTRDIGAGLRAWRGQPGNRDAADQLKRLLHTFKGSARMAGAMGIGQLVHGMETRIEQAVAVDAVTPAFLDSLDASFDRVSLLMEQLQAGERPAEVAAGERMPPPALPVAKAAPAPAAPAEPRVELPEAEAAARAMLRVRADIIDKLVNEAGEIAIARGRIEGEMRSLKGSLLDLTENVIRLRNQLREIEIQAESQMQSRQAMTAEQNLQFDPLEFDRFTRFQELTRMMAESVNDVATSQHALLQNLDHASAALTAQARLNREHSQALMNVRMVPFNTLADRLYRLVRQTAKELGKRANLDIRGGQTELDRSVLEKMTGALEHLLRNAIAHGLETPASRQAAGKPEIGEITLRVAQEGNEIVIELGDDGAGLDFERIHARGVESGLLKAGEATTTEQLTQLIFRPGFSTAGELTAVSGRGIGMDVVRNEAANLGGRIRVDSKPGQGTRFQVYLPLTLAVTQAVLVRSGSRRYAIPSSMVAQVSELKPEAIAAIRADGKAAWLGEDYAWRYLPHLLGDAGSQPEPARRHWLLLLRAGSQHVALEVDDLLGNQELVVKNIGPQLARVVGIAGATVLGDGEIVLILNPVALAGRQAAAPAAPVEGEAEPAPPAAGIVMVVDDSLTVRKITGRLLAREGYHVITAKDGVDALEQLLDVLPDVMLVDIEMPRMDGFDLTRNVRVDPRLKHIPIIMITSRIADKHRNYAKEIGVDHYLGKPYDEDELLQLIAGYVKQTS